MRLHRSPEERQQLAERLAALLARRQDVLFAYVFGSFTLEGAFGDIDVAVYLRPEALEGQKPIFVAFDIANFLEREVRLPMDVHILNAAPLALKWEALRGQSLMTRDAVVRADFIEHTTLAWWDTEVLRRAMVG